VCCSHEEAGQGGRNPNQGCTQLGLCSVKTILPHCSSRPHPAIDMLLSFILPLPAPPPPPQELAAGGRSIATTIHQPSGRLYHKLDKLMLLAEGHMLYYGKAQEVREGPGCLLQGWQPTGKRANAGGPSLEAGERASVRIKGKGLRFPTYACSLCTPCSWPSHP
jgi:hypothetical protein